MASTFSMRNLFENQKISNQNINKNESDVACCTQSHIDLNSHGFDFLNALNV